MVLMKPAYVEQQVKRWMRPDAHRFLRPDWRRYVAPGSALATQYSAYERKYRPDQARDERGRWVDEGGGAEGNASPAASAAEPIAGGGLDDQRILSDAAPDRSYKPGTQLAANDDPYSVDLRAEEQSGGHSIAEHVAKSEAYLLARVRREALDAERRGFAEGLRVGSFLSLQAAEKLVNSTLADNGVAIESVIRGISSGAILTKEFGSITGYEAYAPTERSQPYIRSTTGVTVVILRDVTRAQGFRVRSAFPVTTGR